MSTLLLIFLGFALALCQEAGAHHPGPQLNDALTRQYTAYAYQYYRQPVGCAHGVIGEPPGPHEPGIAWATIGGCSMWFQPETVATSSSTRGAKFAYCGTIMHEVGHTLGLDHVTGAAVSPMNIERSWNHPGCWGPKHVLHRHKHQHRTRIRGKVRTDMHYHKHYHLKVGQP